MAASLTQGRALVILATLMLLSGAVGGQQDVGERVRQFDPLTTCQPFS